MPKRKKKREKENQCVHTVQNKTIAWKRERYICIYLTRRAWWTAKGSGGGGGSTPHPPSSHVETHERNKKSAQKQNCSCLFRCHPLLLYFTIFEEWCHVLDFPPSSNQSISFRQYLFFLSHHTSKIVPHFNLLIISFASAQMGIFSCLLRFLFFLMSSMHNMRCTPLAHANKRPPPFFPRPRAHQWSQKMNLLPTHTQKRSWTHHTPIFIVFSICQCNC